MVTVQIATTITWAQAYMTMNEGVIELVDRLHAYLITVRTWRKKLRRIRGRPRRRGKSLTCHAVMVMAAAASASGVTTFDTDSGEVGIDNRASGCFIKWSWETDEGVRSTHLIPNSYYSKAGGVRLLSPQHFAQTSLGGDERTGSRTTAKAVTLTWGGGLTKTVPLDKKSNVATFHLSPGFNRYAAYCQEAMITPIQDDKSVPTKWQKEDLDD